ncbi:MAG: hypothetical protein IJD13_01875 [Oscillospiraceae bacterium]|nr:hypothetical protein [Oscillospiraceae bacterium]
MPLPMVHISVAALLEERDIVQVTDRAAYYLGSIAPDGIHMRKDPAPDAKIISHLGARKPENIDKVTAFRKKFTEYEANGVSRDYLTGYLVHVLTDIYWKQEFYDGFVERYNADPAPVQEVRTAYYNDTDVADIRLYHAHPKREEVWDLLRTAKGDDLPGLMTGEEADLWNVRTLEWYDVPREYLPVRYASEESVRAFIESAAKLISDYLAQ